MSKIFFISLFIFLSGCVSYPEKVSSFQIESCKQDANSEACWQLANTINGFLKTKFIYTSDLQRYGMVDHWQHHLEEVKNNETFKDDCDGYAYTAVKMAIDLNIPLKRVRLVPVKYKENNMWKKHVIATIGNYSIDNRYPHPKNLDELPYTIIVKIKKWR